MENVIRMNLGYVITLSTLIVVGISCNVVALVYLWRKKTKTSIKDKVIANLCLINILQQGGAFTTELHSSLTKAMGRPPCIASAFITCFGTYTSIGCFVVLIVERYMSILHPFKYVVWFRKRVFRWSMLCAPELFGLLLALPPLFGWNGYKRTKEGTHCSFDFHNKLKYSTSYFYTVATFAFAIPLLITSVCFFRIVTELKKAYKHQSRMCGRGSNISQDTKRSVSGQYLSSVLTGIIYLVSWSPYMVVCFLYEYDARVSAILEMVAGLLAKTSTVTSPIVFLFVEKQFRNFIKRGGKEEVMMMDINRDCDVATSSPV